MLAVKASIRQEMKSRLLNVVKESVTSQSERVLGQLLSLPSVVESRTVCIYLSMQGEIDTYPIISKCLELGKVVYIPKVVGKQAEDMRMFHLQTFDQIGTFPKNKWGIPEPSISVINLEDETYLESIDVVFVPGVAFDSRCGRVGHGKGYYDCFLNRMVAKKKSSGLQEPVFIGLGLEEQIIESCPMDSHDRYLHSVVTASSIFHS